MVVVEPFSIDNEHANVNSAFIEQLSGVLNNLTFCASDSHVAKLQFNCSKQPRVIELTDIKGRYLGKTRAVHFLLKLVTKCWIEKIKINSIFFLSCSPFLIILLKLAGGFFFENVFIMLHGEVEAVNRKQRGVFTLMRALRLRSSVNIRFLIHSKGARDSLCRVLPELENKLDVCRIPVPQEPVERIDYRHSQRMSVGYAGRFIAERNSASFAELATMSQGLLRAEFRCIGHCSDPAYMEQVDFTDVALLPQPKPLDGEVYSKELSCLDVLVSLDPPDRFVYSISGTLLDAIRFQVPIFCLEGSSISRVVDDLPGLIRPFNSLTEMVHGLRDNALKLSGDISCRESLDFVEVWNGRVRTDLRCIF